MTYVARVCNEVCNTETRIYVLYCIVAKASYLSQTFLSIACYQTLVYAVWEQDYNHTW